MMRLNRKKIGTANKPPAPEYYGESSKTPTSLSASFSSPSLSASQAAPPLRHVEGAGVKKANPKTEPASVKLRHIEVAEREHIGGISERELASVKLRHIEVSEREKVQEEEEHQEDATAKDRIKAFRAKAAERSKEAQEAKVCFC